MAQEPHAPWLKFYKTAPAHMDYPRISIYEMIARAAEQFPTNIAYEFQGKKTTYQQFMEKIDAVARGYQSIGISRGDRVVICMPNSPQAVDSFYGLNRIGAIPVMIHPLSAEGEISLYIQKVGAKAILTLDQFQGKVDSAIRATGMPVKLVVARIKDELSLVLGMVYPIVRKDKPAKVPSRRLVSYKGMLKSGKGQNLTLKYPSADDTCCILFSGGTTGSPKGIELTNLNLNALAMQTLAAAEFEAEGMRMLSVMPLFHGFGLGIGIHTPLVFGATDILVPQFTVKTYANLIKKTRPNVLPGVPTLFEALLRTEGLEGYDMSHIRGMFCGGDSLSVELKKKVDAFLKEHNATIQVREGYGTTECVTASCLTPHDDYREGSIGIPFPDTYYGIFDVETGKELAPGTEGEICLRGPSVMKGYLNEPEETAKTLKTHDDGFVWLHTGDLGVMDEDGFVYFRQRMKRLIIVSGLNVYPSQVENAIDSHPDVLYSCCIGVPDPYKMHVVKAFVVLKPGIEPRENIREEILAICRQQVIHHAVPKSIEFRDELPKTLVGKVAYRKLEEEEAAKA